MTSFAEGRDGGLYIGTFGGGLNRLDRSTGRYAVQRADGRPGSLGDDRVMSLLVDRVGNLWAGTLAAGLHRLAPGTSRFERRSGGSPACRPAGRSWLGSRSTQPTH